MICNLKIQISLQSKLRRKKLSVSIHLQLLNAITKATDNELRTNYNWVMPAQSTLPLTLGCVLHYCQCHHEQTGADAAAAAAADVWPAADDDADVMSQCYLSED